MHQDCRQTRSCCDATASCYEKDSGWAECRGDCKAGIHLEDRQFTSQLSPWACRQLDAAASDWEVEKPGGAKIFSRMALGSQELGFKPRGAVLRGRQEGDWIALRGRRGYALLWNQQGYALLRRVGTMVPVTSDASKSTASSTTASPGGPAAERDGSSGLPTESDGSGSAAGGPPIEMFAFKKYLFTAYDSPEGAFAALGAGDDLSPVALDGFARGINLLRLPLTQEQTEYVFGALDANHDGELAIAEFTSGLQSEHGNAQQQPDTVVVDQVHDGADATPAAQGANYGHAVGPRAGAVHGLAEGANESSKFLRREPTDSPSTRPGAMASVAGFLSKVPFCVIANGVLSCFMVPCVVYVGWQFWQVAREKSRRRRPYSVLGERRAFAADVPPSERSLVARRRQSLTSSQMPCSDTGHFGYEIHPGVPGAGAEAPVREVRLTPRELFRGSPSASTPGSSSAASPPNTGKKRRVISL